MKKFVLVPLLLLLTITVSACGDDSPKDKSGIEEPGNNNGDDDNPGESEKYIVLFASRSGNTKSMANEIGEKLNCDVIEIVPAKSYESDYNDMLARAQREQAAIGQGNYPAINTTVENLETYDVVFIGYPIWYGHMATPMQTFLHTHADKLKGKRIALFASSGSSGINTSVTDARNLCPDAEFTETLLLTSGGLSQLNTRIATWIEQLKLQPMPNGENE